MGRLGRQHLPSPPAALQPGIHTQHILPPHGSSLQKPCSIPGLTACLGQRSNAASQAQAGKPTGHNVQGHCSLLNAPHSQHFSCPCALAPCDSFSLLLCLCWLSLLSLCISQSCCGTSTIAIMSWIKNSLFFYTLVFPGGTLFFS